MYVVLVDIFAVVLIVVGVFLVIRRPGGSPTTPGNEDGDDPGTYVRRIAGTMVAAFGLAIGMMVTLCHYASAG
jgi:hypothetical protein